MTTLVTKHRILYLINVRTYIALDNFWAHTLENVVEDNNGFKWFGPLKKLCTNKVYFYLQC